MARYSFYIPTLTPDRFAELSERCYQVATTIGSKLAGWDGTGEPVFNQSEVSFNNPAPDDGDTFNITLNEEGSHVIETNDFPYDLIVRCCLLIFKQELGNTMMLTSNIPENTLDWIQAGVLIEAGNIDLSSGIS